ncbi:MAG TPA: thiamine diphosphokinase [Candidatus Dormibacteraeota bacterium]|nr:thiamine diphosphokinase [Candidatus Dormibacteraeota bacterium]
MAANMKRAVIFLNGNLSDLTLVKQYINKSTLLIGCDGGTRHILELGLQPDVVIGDLDSFRPEEISSDHQPKYITCPTDKDFTDSEFAIRYAIENGYQEVILAGALGDRLDHLLGNIFLLDKFADSKIKIIEGHQEAYIVRAQAEISGHKGDTISFIPILGNPKVSSTGGLKYDLNKYQLSLKGNTGISNVLTRQSTTITVTKGTILVIHQL